MASFKIIKMSSVFYPQDKGRQRKREARAIAGGLGKLAGRNNNNNKKGINGMLTAAPQLSQLRMEPEAANLRARAMVLGKGRSMFLKLHTPPVSQFLKPFL